MTKRGDDDDRGSTMKGGDLNIILFHISIFQNLCYIFISMCFFFFLICTHAYVAFVVLYPCCFCKLYGCFHALIGFYGL